MGAGLIGAAIAWLVLLEPNTRVGFADLILERPFGSFDREAAMILTLLLLAYQNYTKGIN